MGTMGLGAQPFRQQIGHTCNSSMLGRIQWGKYSCALHLLAEYKYNLCRMQHQIHQCIYRHLYTTRYNARRTPSSTSGSSTTCTTANTTYDATTNITAISTTSITMRTKTITTCATNCTR